MGHLVIPLKYRPSTFDALIGQDRVRNNLQALICKQIIPPAILLCGTRGVGKTSAARIFAKALLCSSPQKNGNPCITCTSCKQVEGGLHLDVLEIDGASNNGVEAVRELRQTARYLPTAGRHKIYIIDEVHMLSNSAFNALLKILEEPPSHLLFVFATTEPRQLPATILSRVMRLDFQPIPTHIMATHLTTIINNEHRKVSSEAINHIAMLGDGSLRDAEMMLEQVLGFFPADHEITSENLSELFPILNPMHIIALLGHIGQEHTKEALAAMHHLFQQGYEPYTLALEFQRFLRYLLLAKEAPDLLSTELQYAPLMIEELKQIAALSLFSGSGLITISMCMLKTLDIMRTADNPKWVLESSVVQLSQLRLWAPLASPSSTFFTKSPSSSPSPTIAKNVVVQKASISVKPPQAEATGVEDFLTWIQEKDAVLHGLLCSCSIHITAKHIKIQMQHNAFTYEQLKERRNQEKLLELLRHSPFGLRLLSFEGQMGATMTSSTEKVPHIPDMEERRLHLMEHPVVQSLQSQINAEIAKVVVDQDVLES